MFDRVTWVRGFESGPLRVVYSRRERDGRVGFSVEWHGRSERNCWVEAVRVDAYPGDVHVHWFPRDGGSFQRQLEPTVHRPSVLGAVDLAQDFTESEVHSLLSECGFADAVADALRYAQAQREVRENLFLPLRAGQSAPTLTRPATYPATESAEFADGPAIVSALRTDGYAVVGAHVSSEIARLRLLADDAFARADVPHLHRHPEGWDEVMKVAEIAEEFRPLLFDPVAVAAAVALLGPDIELASTGELDRKRPMSQQAFCGWHNDFTWMRFVNRPRPFYWLAAYFFLSDITESSGPVWVLPGSHLAADEPDIEHNYADGRGRLLEGAVPIVGPAGTMVLLNNEIWHMSPPNESAQDRIMFKAHFKPSWMRPWGLGRAPSREFAGTQDEPAAKQLLGGYDYDSVPWDYGRDATIARYPVVQWLASNGISVDAWVSSAAVPTRAV